MQYKRKESTFLLTAYINALTTNLLQVALIIIYIVRKNDFYYTVNSKQQFYVDENFNQEIKCCMSLLIENAAFYDSEPEVENFQVSKNIPF